MNFINNVLNRFNNFNVVLQVIGKKIENEISTLIWLLPRYANKSLIFS